MCVCVNYSSVNYISLTFSLPVHFVCVCVCWLVGLVQITPRRRTLYRKFFQFHRHLVSLFYLLHQHDIYFHLCIALSLSFFLSFFGVSGNGVIVNVVCKQTASPKKCCHLNITQGILHFTRRSYPFTKGCNQDKKGVHCQTIFRVFRSFSWINNANHLYLACILLAQCMLDSEFRLGSRAF